MRAEVLIVGAGASGLGAAIELLRRGHTDLLVLEAGEDLGGTWRDNTYPGIAVDIPVTSYCYSYEMGFPWSRLYAPGAEVLAYLRHCARKYGVLERIRTGCRVREARFDEAASEWTLELEDGRRCVGRFLIAATGLFATPKLPAFPGLEGFAGPRFHTARWDHGVSLAGKRVGVVGTGASAVQVIPEVAREASQLVVFQRTPIWISPRFDPALRPGAPTERPTLRQRLRRWVSELAFELVTYGIVHYRRMALWLRAFQRVVRAWMRRQVRDPAVAQKLLPDYDLGCKRPTASSTYLATFNLEHVTLETAPIARVLPAGVVVEGGAEHALDVLVFATGFDTTERGNQPSFRVVGREGRELHAFWDRERFQAYAGIAVRGFPNLFLTHGPYSGGFNWFSMLETHLVQILACLERAWDTGSRRVEVNAAAYRRYVAETERRAARAVFQAGRCGGARSYYVDRHGDASLPSPRTPFERERWARARGAADFDVE
ncbi:MAG: NAD(P)/FAD-dependent oxidoreductase [Planctomycetota bacterium]